VSRRLTHTWTRLRRDRRDAGRRDEYPRAVGQDRREGPKFWMAALTDILNHGVRGRVLPVCGGLIGPPEVVGNVWPLTAVQTACDHGR
jgi:transposase-like protein